MTVCGPACFPGSIICETIILDNSDRTSPVTQGPFPPVSVVSRDKRHRGAACVHTRRLFGHFPSI